MSEKEGSVLQQSLGAADQKKNARDNLRHAGEFTKIENTAIVYVLRGWFGALIRPENATEIVQASDDVWAKTTLFEHFVSELDSNPATRTKESLAVYDELKGRAKAAQDKLNAILGETNEDERINDKTDKIVENVIQKLGL